MSFKECKLARHVFLSFVEEDLTRVHLFRGQAKNQNSDLEFDDYSVKVPINSSNAAYIKTQISAKIRVASVTIVLLGPTTHTSVWVTWEINKAVELGKKVFGVRLYNDKICPIPSALTSAGGKVLGWDISAIVKEIG